MSGACSKPGVSTRCFFADILALTDFYKGSYETVLSRGGQMGLLDPIPMLSMIARVTRHLGLGVTMSSTFHKAFHLARVLGTLDVLSGGRVAWNIVTSSSKHPGAQFRHRADGPRHPL